MGKHPKLSPDITAYDKAVREGKAIIAQIETARERLMRLGELADGVEKEYGESKLKDFARDIGVAACTLERCRSVYRAWQGNKAPAPKSWAVAQELQGHPDRFKIIRENPDLTKREARQKMRVHKCEQKSALVVGDPKDWRRQEQRKWFNAVVDHFQEIGRDAQTADDKLSSEQRRILRECVEPGLLPALRANVEDALRLVEFFERLVAEPDPREEEQEVGESDQEEQEAVEEAAAA